MVELEETMMPMKEVIAKPTGMVISWERKASDGLRAKRAKSGSGKESELGGSLWEDGGEREEKGLTVDDECGEIGDRTHDS